MKIAGIPSQWRYWPFYLLVTTLFFGSLALHYFALFVMIFFFVVRRPKFRNSIFILTPLFIILVASLSYFYNLFTGLADRYTILFWFASYLPPFLLMWAVYFYRGEISVYPVYRLYKMFVYLQTFLLIYDAFRFRTFVVGDPATGTIGDANWVAFHICVVIILEVTKLVALSKSSIFRIKDNLKSIVELFYFFIVLIIPESTANLGLIFIILGILFFNEYILAHLRVAGIVTFIVCAVLGFYLVSDTIVFERIERAVYDLMNDNIDENPYLFKASVYKRIATGALYQDVNPVVGSGPSTFTSRSSVMRMPEERVNDFFIEVPYFKSRVFAKYISPVYAQWRVSRESHGNFASPQTSVVSVAIELGLLGLGAFCLYFYFIIRALRRKSFDGSNLFLRKFGLYLTFFFILSLFHLNFWEYPIVSFTYILFIFLILKGGYAQETAQ